MLTYFACMAMPQLQAGYDTAATVGTKSFTLHVHFHWDNKKAWKLPEVCVSADAGRTASVVGSCSGVCWDVSVSLSPLLSPLLACTAINFSVSGTVQDSITEMRGRTACMTGKEQASLENGFCSLPVTTEGAIQQMQRPKLARHT